MKVLVIGGTGLLGAEAARQLISRGHSVSALALPPLPAGASLPVEMHIEFGNYMAMTDDELSAHLSGCEGLVFAAGVDERVEGQKPIYDLFYQYNIASLERLLRLAKKCSVRHAVICGSYFAYFAKQWTNMPLARDHPYIRSRVDQENMALSFADEAFDVSILELPYIFGAQPGRKPVWVFLAKMIRSMPLATFYPKGGSAMVTVRQVGEALAGALERSSGGVCYPIGYANLTWREMLCTMHRALGYPHKPIVSIPTRMFAVACRQVDRKRQRAGIEGGLCMEKFVPVMCANTFIDRSLGCDMLGVTPDDVEAAICDSIRLSADVLDGKTSVIGMRGE